MEEDIYEAMIAFPAVERQHARTALGHLEALFAELREAPERGTRQPQVKPVN